MHSSPTARKVSIVLSDNIYLPSPFTMFSKIRVDQPQAPDTVDKLLQLYNLKWEVVNRKEDSLLASTYR